MERIDSQLSAFAKGLGVLSSLVESSSTSTDLKTIHATWAELSGWTTSRIVHSRGDIEKTLHWPETNRNTASTNDSITQHSITLPDGSRFLLAASRHYVELWRNYERNYLKLSAELFARCPAFEAWAAPILSPARLNQRLADTSVIASRMAHDFDNVLTGIIGFADLLRSSVPAGGDAEMYVREIAAAGQKGVGFTRQLHQFGRAGQCRSQSGSIASAWRKEEQRLRASLPQSVQLTGHIPADLPNVGLETGAIQIVLGHLLDNALEAGAAVRKVHVAARLLTIGDGEVPAYRGRLAKGPHAEIAVSDDGPGIPPEIANKLFAEPFLTTKVRHRGLGLSTVFRILYAHRGGVRIDAAATPATGVTVRVLLPAAASAVHP